MKKKNRQEIVSKEGKKLGKTVDVRKTETKTPTSPSVATPNAKPLDTKSVE